MGQQIFCKTKIKTRTRSFCFIDNGKGGALAIVLLLIALSAVFMGVIINYFDFQFKSLTKVKSLQSEAAFRQILRYMDSRDCKETFSNPTRSIGDSITQLKDKDGLILFDINNQGSKDFEVVKIETGPATPGKATMTFHYKRSGTFLDKQTTLECSSGDTSGCFSEECELRLSDSHSGSGPIGDCAIISCTGGGELEVAKPQCFKVTKETGLEQTLIGCGGTIDKSAPLAYGFNTGSSSSGSIFLGYRAGQGSGGSNNFFLGREAGQGSGGSNNIFLGYRAGQGSGGSNNVLLGAEASDTGSNQIRIKGGSSSSVNLGNGGFIKLGGSAELRLDGSIKLKSGDGSTELEVKNGDEMVVNRNHTVTLKDAVYPLKQVTFASDRITLENGDIIVQDIRDIRTFMNRHPVDYHHTQYALRGHNHPGPTCFASGINCTSDRRLKENIRSLDGEKSLEQIADLEPVSFYWKDRGFSPGEHLGFIAQDVRTSIPQLVKESQNKSHTHDHGRRFLSLDYVGLIPVIVSALKNLIKTLKEYKIRLGNLFEEIKVDGERIMAESRELDQLESEIFGLSEKVKKMKDENQSMRKRLSQIKNDQ